MCCAQAKSFAGRDALLFERSLIDLGPHSDLTFRSSMEGPGEAQAREHVT